jgi:hypothetical protein
LKDSGGTGHADTVKRFGEGVPDGAAGGTGIAFYNNAIYAEVNDRIVRYALRPGEMVPSGKPETILSGMPLVGDWSRPTRRSSSPTQLIMNRLEDQIVVCSSAAIVSAALRIAVA